MQEPRDPVDGVLRSLARQAWVPGPHREQLEDALLREFDRAGRPAGLRNRRALWVFGSVLLAGGVGFAATGGRETLKKLWVKVYRIGSGASVLEAEIEPTVDGGEFRSTVVLDDGRSAELHVRVVEDESGVAGMKQVTVEIPADDAGAIDAAPVEQTLQVDVAAHDATRSP